MPSFSLFLLLPFFDSVFMACFSLFGLTITVHGRDANILQMVTLHYNAVLVYDLTPLLKWVHKNLQWSLQTDQPCAEI